MIRSSRPWAAGCLLLIVALSSPIRAQDNEATPRKLLDQSGRIVILGDSITYVGHYVVYLEAWLAATRREPPVVIDVGLPSETVSGLSEEGHAGGKFPRPDLAERLERVLSVTKPDLVIACYGINCGIYQPFDQERLAAYQHGLTRLRDACRRAGAQVIHVTPPFYDDLRSPRDFSYNEVLDRYSDWLVGQRALGWTVIDLHSAMTREVRERRMSSPDFTFQPDGVHPNTDGHWFITSELIRAFGDARSASASSPADMLKQHAVPDDLLVFVMQRLQVRRDAYLSTAGHKRPGVAAGLPLEQAEPKAADWTSRIRKLVPTPPASPNPQ